MTIATVHGLPGIDFVTVERRSVAGCIDEIEHLAKAEGNSRFAIMTVLQAVCDKSLWGEALWVAWQEARGALEVLAETEVTDWDHQTWQDKADRAVLRLVHGSDYYGGSAA